MTQNQLAFNRNLISEAELREKERANRAQESIASMKNEIAAFEAETKRGNLYLDTLSNPYISFADPTQVKWGHELYLDSPSNTGISFLDSSTIWDTGAGHSQSLSQAKTTSGMFADFGSFFRGLGNLIGNLF